MTGFEWPDVHAALDKVAEETRELREAAVSGDAEAIGDELGGPAVCCREGCALCGR